MVDQIVVRDFQVSAYFYNCPFLWLYFLKLHPIYISTFQFCYEKKLKHIFDQWEKVVCA